MKLLDEYSEATNFLGDPGIESSQLAPLAPLAVQEMHPGHKPGRFAEVGPESGPLEALMAAAAE